jgi:hypothetical protein
MKSHFHRSDGLDACSQLRAATGRANASAHVGIGRIAGERFRERRAHVVGRGERQRAARRAGHLEQDLAVVAASGGGRNTREAACTRPWSFVKVPSFSTHADPGSTTSAARARSVRTGPWYTRNASRPDRLASTSHATSPSDHSGPGLTTYKALSRPASISSRRPEMSGAPSLPAPTGSPRSRAPFTFGASTGGTRNFVVGGCTFGV